MAAMTVDRFTPKRSASTRWLGSLDPIGQSPLEMRGAHETDDLFGYGLAAAAVRLPS